MSATIGTASPTTTTANATTFRSAIEMMRAHHLSRKGGDFFAAYPHLQPLLRTPGKKDRNRRPAKGRPSLLAANVVALDAPETASADDFLTPMKTAMRSRQQLVADATATGTTAAANDLKADKDTNGFRARLEAQRQQALKDSDANINAAFDKAGDFGEAHPALQGPILAGMNVVQEIISKFTSLISDMVGKVLSAIEDLLKEITKTLEDAVGSFSGEAGELLGSLL